EIERRQSAICNLKSAIPKISDFGLAKRLDSESTAWTQQGDVLGTASYMAPEQAAGRIEIGPPADVYSMGAILYELLTGRPPFQPQPGSATIKRVPSEPPTHPHLRRRDVRRDHEVFPVKSQKKNPPRRYGSALELAEDLSRFLGAKPVLAIPVSEKE